MATIIGTNGSAQSKGSFYRAQNCTSNPETSQILWPGHFSHYSITLYGFNGRLLPAFMAAVACLITWTIPIKQTACEKHVNILGMASAVIIFDFSLQEGFTITKKKMSTLQKRHQALSHCFQIDNETGCEENKKWNEKKGRRGGWGKERMR